MLLNGETEEIILREKEQLGWIAAAIEEARNLGASGEELTKLTQLSNALLSKINLPGTKAQLKPVYSRRQVGQMRVLTKLTLVFKWGGEVCHCFNHFLVPTPTTFKVYSFSSLPIQRSRRKSEKRYFNNE